MNPQTIQTALLENLPVAAFTVDATSKVLTWNKGMEELTGKSAAEILGKKAWTAFFPRKKANPLDDCLMSGEAVEEEFEVGNGTKTRVQFKAMPVLNDEGEVMGASAVLAASGANGDAVRMRSAVDGAGVAIMMVDRDLKITYANDSTMKLVSKNVDTFKKQFPGFDPNKLIGTCVDQFHKDPSHQRKILGNPANLPWRADIHVGELTFALNITAITSPSGEYIGNTLEWSDVTAARASENNVSRLNSMVEGSAVNFMVCDRDFRITYMNPAVRNMLSKHQNALRKLFPDFDVNTLPGRCIDDFHQDPGRIRSLLNNVKNLPMRSEITVGGLEFALNVSALFDASGKHIGNAVEWNDQNARADYRNEFNALVESLQKGDLRKRGRTEHLDTTYRPMMDGINSVIGTIVAPINELRDRLGEVSKGNLTAYVEGSYEGDHAALKQALNTTLDSLNDILNQVNIAADQINGGSQEVSSSSQSLSQAATEQASSLEQITASMTEMASQTKQNAENAAQANQLAIAARGSADSGNQSMSEMLNAMKDISDSSQNISKIIKVIDEIAFQTNLLALNAAVEAARAGTHGKGFAVVAEEVRNLAARSAKAARETTELIENSKQKVDKGSNIARQTAESLNAIVSNISKVTDLVAEISAASNEQAQGIAQVNQGLGQLDQVTQQNTASSEESAAAAEELSSQASAMRDMLKKFQLAKVNGKSGDAQMTPEMVEMFKQFMAQQQGHAAGSGARKPATFQAKPPAPAAPAAHAKPAQTQWGKPAAPARKAQPKPEDVISLDDKEFGKY